MMALFFTPMLEVMHTRGQMILETQNTDKRPKTEDEQSTLGRFIS